MRKDWEVRKLGEVCEFYNGQAHEKCIDDKGKFIVINSKFISQDGKIIKRTNLQLFPLKCEDITMVMSDVPNGKAIAKCFLVDRNDTYTLNQRICAIRSNKFVTRFLFYQINRNPYLLSFDNGENQTNLRKDDILNCPLLIPPLPEQQRIVKVLDEAFAAIAKAKENAEKNLQNAREIFESYLQSVFENRGDGWEVCNLEDYVKFIDYRGKTPKKTTTGLRLITAKNVKNGFLQREPEEFINPNIYDAWMTRGIPQIGDVLFTTEAPLANVAQLDTSEKVAFAQRIIILQPQANKINQTFLKYLLLSKPMREKILAKGTGATVLGIKSSLLKKIEIYFPTIPDQQKIVKVIDALSTETKKLEAIYNQKTADLEELKKSILQKAFDGEFTTKKSFHSTNPLGLGINTSKVLKDNYKFDNLHLGMMAAVKGLEDRYKLDNLHLGMTALKGLEDKYKFNNLHLGMTALKGLEDNYKFDNLNLGMAAIKGIEDRYKFDNLNLGLKSLASSINSIVGNGLPSSLGNIQNDLSFFSELYRDNVEIKTLTNSITSNISESLKQVQKSLLPYTQSMVKMQNTITPLINSLKHNNIITDNPKYWDAISGSLMAQSSMLADLNFVTRPTKEIKELLSGLNFAPITNNMFSSFERTFKNSTIEAQNIAILKVSPTLKSIVNNELPRGMTSLISTMHEETAKRFLQTDIFSYDTEKKVFFNEKAREENAPIESINPMFSVLMYFNSISEAEMLEFYGFLSNNPMSGHSHRVGIKISSFVQQHTKTDLICFDTEYFYRARTRENQDERPWTEAEMRNAPYGVPSTGRYNSAGISSFYAADTPSGAVSEVSKHERDATLFQVAKFSMRYNAKILDMTSWKNPFAKYCAFKLDRNPNSTNRPEYLVPCFFAECLRLNGIDGIKYKGGADYRNYVFWEGHYFVLNGFTFESKP